MRAIDLCFIFPMVLCGAAVAQDAPIFSGPQVGEKLPPFAFRGVYGDEAGKPMDEVARADGKPLVLAFVHEVTRPGLGLTRVIMDYAAQRKKDGLHAAIVFLTDDPTATEKWMTIPSVRDQALPKGVAAGLFPEGKEGPGVYGLNRNVSLTVLVAKDHQVTANFALVQPSVQADGPKILKAIVDALGGGEVPSIDQLAGRGAMRGRVEPNQTNPALDAKLRELIGPLLRAKTPEEAHEAAAKVDQYAAERPEFAKELGARARLIIASEKFSDYGQTAEAREHLKRWAEKFAPARQKP
jgi:hypothetical protein